MMRAGRNEARWISPEMHPGLRSSWMIEWWRGTGGGKKWTSRTNTWVGNETWKALPRARGAGIDEKLTEMIF